MQIPAVGALEAALSNPTTNLSAEQQLENADVAQLEMRGSGPSAKREAEGADAVKASVHSTDFGQRANGAPNIGTMGTSQPVEAGEGLTKRELFDYLAEVERSSAAYGTPPSALLQSGLGALDGTLQDISAALEKGRNGVSTPGETADAGGAAQPQPDPNANPLDTFVTQAEQMLDRSMSVMWAAANLEVVMSSVTSVTSSTSTLIKQQ